jgi:DNA-binding NarL/FixJ family response regulator
MRCLVLDDEPHDREVIARVLQRAGHEVVCTDEAPTALELVRRHTFDVVLVDLGMPGIDGVTALRLLRRDAPELRLLVVSGFDDRAHVISAVAAGADGYVVKTDLPSLAPAVEDVSVGGGPMSRQIAHYVLEELRLTGPDPAREPQRVLSKRQWDVLKELARGLTYRQIADALLISENTVRHHIREISRKLEVKGGKAAVRHVLGGADIPDRAELAQLDPRPQLGDTEPAPPGSRDDE